MSSDDRLIELLNALRDRPYEHSLFATLRRFECLAMDKPRLGQSVRPAEDSVRLGQEPTLAFAASQVAYLEAQRGNIPPRLAVFGPGLFGPNGPLPVHLTEYVRERRRSFDDATMWRFIDLFHHRMLSLLYRAWANTEPVVNADRPDDDRFTTYVASLVGMGLPSLRDRDAFPDHGRLHYAGHFARQSHSPQGLLGAIADYFDVDVTLEQFVGAWLAIPAAGWWRLGGAAQFGGLGLGTTVGESVWSCQHKFRLVIGPLALDEFKRFLPGSESLNRLIALVRNFCGDELDWDVQLILKKAAVPAMQLGGQSALGRTSWLECAHREHDARDTLLEPMAGVWRAQAA